MVPGQNPEVGGVAVASVCLFVCLFGITQHQKDAAPHPPSGYLPIPAPSKLGHSRLLLVVCEVPLCRRETSFPPSTDVTAQFRGTRRAESEFLTLVPTGQHLYRWNPATVRSVPVPLALQTHFRSYTGQRLTLRRLQRDRFRQLGGFLTFCLPSF